MTRKHLLICLALLSALPLCAKDTTLTLGGKDGWPPLSSMEGVSTGKGRFGYEAILLNTDSSALTPATDLLLTFEEDIPEDSAGNYTVVSSSLVPGTNTAMGKRSGLSTGSSKGIRLMGKPGSIFGTAGNPGSFTIEFWLYPSISDNGEQLFSWHSSTNRNSRPVYQYILASVFNNRMEWKFSNVFRPQDDSATEITLTGAGNLIPGQWAHHSVSFDEETGLIEYRMNGKTEATAFCTSTGKERGSIYPAFLGVPAEIEICPKYTGFIDDFRIVRGAVLPKANYDKYPQTPGRFETMPIPGGSRRAVLQQLDAVTTIPADTAVYFYVRAGDNFYTWTDESPEWQPVEPGKKITGIEGRFFQVAAELYSDGEGKKSPSVTSITLKWQEDQPPLPPLRVWVQAGDGSAEVSWTASVDLDTAGYMVYYGERPGEYLGRTAVQGPSPVNAGNTLSLRLEGLTNGKIYYFAVAAYDGTEPIYPGDLSREVSARPVRTRHE